MKKPRTLTILPPEKLLQKPLRFFSLLKRQHKTVGDLLRENGKPTFFPVRYKGFRDPIILHGEAIDDSVSPFRSPFLDAVVADIRELKIELDSGKKGRRYRITGVDISSKLINAIKFKPKWIEASSFADVIYAHLAQDPLFNEAIMTVVIKATASRIQTKLEYQHRDLIIGNPHHGETRE